MAPPLGYPKTKKLSASVGLRPLTPRPGALPLDPAGGSAPRLPSLPPAPNLPLHHLRASCGKMRQHVC